jgi:DNA-binding MarR family transcriptional regulator
VATRWLDGAEREAWLRLVAVVELLPGVLDTQLRASSGLTHFEYFVLAMLSEAPERTLRMTALAHRTNATLPRLSHVVRRLEDRGLVDRFPCPEDGRATNARLTEAGWNAVVAAAPGHVDAVRHYVLDPLTREQLHQLHVIGDALLTRLGPDGRMTAPYAPTTSSSAELTPPTSSVKRSCSGASPPAGQPVDLRQGRAPERDTGQVADPAAATVAAHQEPRGHRVRPVRW